MVKHHICLKSNLRQDKRKYQPRIYCLTTNPALRWCIWDCDEITDVSVKLFGDSLTKEKTNIFFIRFYELIERLTDLSRCFQMEC